MPLLVYLDQLHLGDMTEEQLGVLTKMVDDDIIVVPSSDIHLIETIKQTTRFRPETLRRISALRRNLVLLPEVVVLALEWLASRGCGSFREHIVGLSPGQGVVWDGAVADAVEMAGEVLDDDSGTKVAEATRASFQDAAANLEALKRVTVQHIREQLFLGLGMLDISPHPTLDDLPTDEEALAVMFPSIGLRRAFLAHAKQLEPNDIADLSFICRTVPHFDVVAVDRKMHDRLHATRGRLSTALVQSLFRARIVRTSAHAIDAILALTQLER